MARGQSGFTLIELIAIIVILGVIGITISARMPDGDIAAVQSSRDDLIAALFFAQQKAMAQSDISLEINTGSVSVARGGNDIIVHQDAYPRAFASGVTATNTLSFAYNKLGAIVGLTEPEQVTLQKGSTSATITIEPSGYAY
ncbi:prepilin-type N-terminal cleavage/methylation domain-containing protein [Gilvimarinus sp. DA14]|uniref:prepilin-type N-terminal cleavage/methylation domain-containing protein n=1 Tax=Gilvimarinus sp. DA14 TaxID=2956798 RepID=UPI0020B8288B|nr:prepilin-type N-terminal cleavage/methylation domain-containing protein [Gilvimarinus sp. DA14]UTF61393.1 prepilin-type N-terminal cleavage/methylation domain-containing protein [Gilvimarinus sp. DA14]